MPTHIQLLSSSTVSSGGPPISNSNGSDQANVGNQSGTDQPDPNQLGTFADAFAKERGNADSAGQLEKERAAAENHSLTDQRPEDKTPEAEADLTNNDAQRISGQEGDTPSFQKQPLSGPPQTTDEGNLLRATHDKVPVDARPLEARPINELNLDPLHGAALPNGSDPHSATDMAALESIPNSPLHGFDGHGLEALLPLDQSEMRNFGPKDSSSPSAASLAAGMQQTPESDRWISQFANISANPSGGTGAPPSPTSSAVSMKGQVTSANVDQHPNRQLTLRTNATLLSKAQADLPDYPSTSAGNAASNVDGANQALSTNHSAPFMGAGSPLVSLPLGGSAQADKVVPVAQAENGSAERRARDYSMAQSDSQITLRTLQRGGANTQILPVKLWQGTAAVPPETQVTKDLLTIDPISGEPRLPSASPFTASPTQLARAELPSHVSRQLADVIQQMPNRPVEITLKPQELGAVRLTVQQADTGIMVNLTAERPETLDLMRRHIDQLGQDFQAIGYTNIAFSFAGSDADPDAQQEEQAKEFSDTAEENAVLQTTQIYLSTSTNSGVDLRL